jgi:hypothetical protein
MHTEWVPALISSSSRSVALTRCCSACACGPVAGPVAARALCEPPNCFRGGWPYCFRAVLLPRLELPVEAVRRELFVAVVAVLLDRAPGVMPRALRTGPPSAYGFRCFFSSFHHAWYGCPCSGSIPSGGWIGGNPILGGGSDGKASSSGLLRLRVGEKWRHQPP